MVSDARHATAERHAAERLADPVGNRQTAEKVVALAFEIARANAELLSSEANAAQGDAAPSSQQALDQQKKQIDAQRQSIQDELDADRRRAAASGKARSQIEAKLPELQGELAMVDARKNLLDTMADFVNESDPKGAGANALKAHIDAIAATIPSAYGGTTPAPGGSASAGSAGNALPAASAATAAPARYGIWDLGRDALRLRGKIKTIDAVDQHTAQLAATFQKISASPLDQLRAYSARSDALASQADNAGSAVLKTLRGKFDTLAWLFKQTSAILIPLSKEEVLLQQYRHNLRNWRTPRAGNITKHWQRSASAWEFWPACWPAYSCSREVWRRAVLRFAHEARRRYQLLLVRRIVVWAAAVTLIGLSFTTEISSLATFAGLLTAGVAVAMQSVLVSVVGYFFLIGKYGIRVGDKIQIGTVVGEVIDIGLVRMHLMELNTQGPLGADGQSRCVCQSDRVPSIGRPVQANSRREFILA